MKILIITKYRWKSRLKKHETISKLMMTGGIQAIFSTIHLDVGKPIITDGRIDPQWYETNITKHAQDYDHVIFQFSESDGKRWKIKSGLRGFNIKDLDRIGESWVCCDEHSVVKFKDGTERDKYTKVVPHEIAHELKNKGLTKLEIHDFDYHNDINNIEGFYRALATQNSLLSKLKELTEKLQLLRKTPTDILPIVRTGADRIIADMELLGHPVRIVEGFRSIERQNELYAQGRTKPGDVVTNAKGGESFHNYGVAVDFVFKKEGYNATTEQWNLLGKTAEKHGFSWGGRWKGFIDRPHVEMTLGYTLKDFQNGTVDYSKYTYHK